VHIAAKWRELAQRHDSRAAIIDERGALSFREFHSRM